jgi:hypothetical protein
MIPISIGKHFRQKTLTDLFTVDLASKMVHRSLTIKRKVANGDLFRCSYFW